MTVPLVSRSASSLRPGDRFVWCGLSLTVRRVERVLKGRARPGRKIWVLDPDGDEMWLHYYDDEVIEFRR